MPAHVRGVLLQCHASWCRVVGTDCPTSQHTHQVAACNNLHAARMPQLRGAKYADGSIIRSAAISLDGALDYELGDREEWTLELSLWAEGFRDMLCCQYGTAIYLALAARW